MPKHQTNNLELQELYDAIRDIDGVDAIDGRSTNISYRANVPTLEVIYKRLTEIYGEPTKNHPLLDDIEWKAANFTISVNKAGSMTDRATWHLIHVFGR